MAYRSLLEAKHLGHASSRRSGDKNHVHIPFVLNAGELPRVNPCAVALDHDDIDSGTLDIARFTTCDRVFVIALILPSTATARRTSVRYARSLLTIPRSC